MIIVAENKIIVAENKIIIAESKIIVAGNKIIVAEKQTLKMNDVLSHPLVAIPWALASVDGRR